MIALDTNVLVRVVTADDDEQTARARELMESERLFLPKSVLLETEWVLRYTYGLERDVIAETLRRVLGLAQLLVEDVGSVARALSWYLGGLDFADALHLASSGEAREFATFDRPFAETSAALGCVPPVRPLGRS